MSKHPIAFVEWRTRDAARLEVFYGGLFGWSFRETAPGGYVLVETSNREIGAGVVVSPPDGPGPSMLNVVRVKNLEKTEARVAKLGGRVVTSQRVVEGWGRFSILLDVDGNQIGVVELERDGRKRSKQRAAKARVAAHEADAAQEAKAAKKKKKEKKEKKEHAREDEKREQRKQAESAGSPATGAGSRAGDAADAPHSTPGAKDS